MNANRHASWQADQLEGLMTEQAGKRWPEHRCALLSNPAAEREIDAIVLEELWPGVEQALQGSRLVALTGGGDTTPAQAMETLYRKFTTSFIIEDPERPAGPRARKPWHCRFEIEAWIEGYFLNKTTILSFPEEFAMAKLTRLLKEPLMQGRPPELSWYEGFDGPGTYNVELSTGQGSDWNLRGKDGAREYAALGRRCTNLEAGRGRCPDGSMGHERSSCRPVAEEQTFRDPRSDCGL